MQAALTLHSPPQTRALACTEWGTHGPNFSTNLLDLQKFSANMFEQQKTVL